MCDFLRRLFGGGDEDRLRAQLSEQQAQTRSANEAAAAAAEQAQRSAAAALVLPADNDAARRASERRMRQLLQGGPVGSGVQNFGAAPVSYNVLFGA